MDRNSNYNYTHNPPMYNYNYNNHLNVNNGPIPVPGSYYVPRNIPANFPPPPRYHYGRGNPINEYPNQNGYYQAPPNQYHPPGPSYRNGNGNVYISPHINSRTVKKDHLHEEDFSEKLIAYARFNRNTDLIKTILSEVMVPDVRQVVTTSRLEVLKEQVRTLEEHHKKVDEDVKQMEKECDNKKRKFIESNDKFHKDYKRLCQPVVGVQMYHDLVAKHYNAMKEFAEKQRWEMTLAWAQQTAAAETSGAATNQNPSDPTIADILGNGPIVDGSGGNNDSPQSGSN